MNKYVNWPFIWYQPHEFQIIAVSVEMILMFENSMKNKYHRYNRRMKTSEGVIRWWESIRQSMSKYVIHEL